MNFCELFGYIVLLELQILREISTEFISNTNYTIQNSTDADITWIKITTIEPIERDQECENCISSEYADQNFNLSFRRKRRKRRRNKKPTLSNHFHRVRNQCRKSHDHSQKKYSTRVHLERPVQFLEVPHNMEVNEIRKTDLDLKVLRLETTTQALKEIFSPAKYLLPPLVHEYNNGNFVASEFLLKTPSSNDRGSTKFKNTAYYRENEIDYPALNVEDSKRQHATTVKTSKSTFKPIVVQSAEIYAEKNINNSQNYVKHQENLSFMSAEVAKAGMKVINVMSEFRHSTDYYKQPPKLNYSHVQGQALQNEFEKEVLPVENFQQVSIMDNSRKLNSEQFHEQSELQQTEKLRKQNRQYQSFHSVTTSTQNYQPILSQEHQQKSTRQYQTKSYYTQNQKLKPYQFELPKTQNNQQNNELFDQQSQGETQDIQDKQDNQQFREWPIAQSVQLREDPQKSYNRQYKDQPHLIQNHDQMQLKDNQDTVNYQPFQFQSPITQNQTKVQSKNYPQATLYPKFQEQISAKIYEETIRNVSNKYTGPSSQENLVLQLTTRQMERSTTITPVQQSTHNSKKSNVSFKGLELAESNYFSDLPSQSEISSLMQNGGQVIPGTAGKDYPIFSQTLLLKRRFACRGLEGYFADISTRCQVFYVCNGVGAGEPMLCPNGTLFNQELLVCDWWYNVDC